MTILVFKAIAPLSPKRVSSIICNGCGLFIMRSRNNMFIFLRGLPSQLAGSVVCLADISLFC